MLTPKFPDVSVELTGQDGNAFFLISRTRKALEKAGHTEAATEFFNEALNSSSYDEVLQTIMKWVNTD